MRIVCCSCQRHSPPWINLALAMADDQFAVSRHNDLPPVPMPSETAPQAWRIILISLKVSQWPSAMKIKQNVLYSASRTPHSNRRGQSEWVMITKVSTPCPWHSKCMVWCHLFSSMVLSFRKDWDRRNGQTVSKPFKGLCLAMTYQCIMDKNSPLQIDIFSDTVMALRRCLLLTLASLAIAITGSHWLAAVSPPKISGSSSQRSWFCTFLPKNLRIYEKLMLFR